jgi:hypothetical protein
MSTEAAAALVRNVAETDAGAEQTRRERIETAFVALLAAAAVVCASLLAVVTGLSQS